jgi:hypothetical protein
MQKLSTLTVDVDVPMSNSPHITDAAGTEKRCVPDHSGRTADTLSLHATPIPC